MNRPGTDADIRKAFEAIAVDGTGLVEWNEYVFSVMGEKAINFGALSDLESLDMVLKESEGVPVSSEPTGKPEILKRFLFELLQLFLRQCQHRR